MLSSFGGLTDFITSLKNNNRLKVEVDFVSGATVNKVSITAADTTADFLDGKLIVGSSKLTKTVVNPGAAETLSLDVNQAALTLTASQISDFTEAAQDAVGGVLIDTASIDFTYNDAGNSISAAVLPSGVDHNSLANLTTGDPHTQYVNREANATVTDNAITRWDGTTGRDIQNSLATVDDSGGIIAGNFIRPASTSDTTAGNIQYTSTNTEILGRFGSTWNVMGIVPAQTTATGNTSTTSGTYSTISSMTATPAAGTYLILFECSADLGDDTSADIALFVNNVEQTYATKTLSIEATGILGATANYEVPVHITGIATVNGSQVIDIRFRENGGGTLTVGPRQLILIPISR